MRTRRAGVIPVVLPDKPAPNSRTSGMSPRRCDRRVHPPGGTRGCGVLDVRDVPRIRRCPKASICAVFLGRFAWRLNLVPASPTSSGWDIGLRLPALNGLLRPRAPAAPFVLRRRWRLRPSRACGLRKEGRVTYGGFPAKSREGVHGRKEIMCTFRAVGLGLSGQTELGEGRRRRLPWIPCVGVVGSWGRLGAFSVLQAAERSLQALLALSCSCGSNRCPWLAVDEVSSEMYLAEGKR